MITAIAAVVVALLGIGVGLYVVITSKQVHIAFVNRATVDGDAQVLADLSAKSLTVGDGALRASRVESGGAVAVATLDVGSLLIGSGRLVNLEGLMARNRIVTADSGDDVKTVGKGTSAFATSLWPNMKPTYSGPFVASAQPGTLWTCQSSALVHIGVSCTVASSGTVARVDAVKLSAGGKEDAAATVDWVPGIPTVHLSWTLVVREGDALGFVFEAPTADVQVNHFTVFLASR